MKQHISIRLISMIITCLCSTIAVYAQSFSNKYGKVTNDELAMTIYEPDTTASAVIIFKKGTTTYDFVVDDFRVTYFMEVKIKILKPEGAKYADVSIPYYLSDKSTITKETVSQIEAVAYNLEGGKVVKTKMDKNYIFRERLNNSYMQVKFSIPAVKEGTVIEYKYKLSSDFYFELNNFVMQHDIPVIYGNYDITIPEYYKFNIDMRGAERLETKDDKVSFSIVVSGQTLRAQARNLNFTGHHIPAIKSDSYIWCPSDYRSQINFELHGIDYPWTVYRPFTSTWDDIDEMLLKSDDFGRLLKMRNPFREEMKALPLDEMSTDEKIGAVYTLLKQKVSWNENYRLFEEDMKKTIKEGTGSNAAINFVLMSMLRDAGIESLPLVMSRRSMGILPLAHPSIKKINTFVVGILNSDTTMVFLDGSVTEGCVNVLPPVLMVRQARVVNKEYSNKWFNLSALGQHQLKSMTNSTINENGELEGTTVTAYLGQFASEQRRDYKAAKDSTEYIEKKEAEDNIKISSYRHEAMNTFSPEIKENISFTKPVTSNEEYIYINPMVFAHISENPFIQENRKLPVELPYPSSMRIFNTFTIPEGYQVEELPKPAAVTLDDNSGSCRYLIQTTGNKVTLTYIFMMNKTLFTAEEYKDLKHFWEMIAEKNNEMIVLKKVSL